MYLIHWSIPFSEVLQHGEKIMEQKEDQKGVISSNPSSVMSYLICLNLGLLLS